MSILSINKSVNTNHVDLLVIQGSPFCNIACKYCYLPNRGSTDKISLSLIENIFKRLAESDLFSDKLTVVWHAGEPLAVPIEYYKQIFKTIDSLIPEEVELSHSFQTNGTLINQDWCDLIKQRNIRIGLSIDGPQFIHDKYRVKRNGKGSFNEAMKGVSVLKDNDIDFHVIAVVTRFALDYPDEIFNFFLEQGIRRVGFNIEEVEGVNQTSSVVSESKSKVYAFFERMLQLQKEAEGMIVIREFESAFRKIVGNPLAGSNSIKNTIPNSHLLKPFGIISVDVNGNFTSFSPELLGQKSSTYGDFILGNVINNTFNEVINTDKFKRIYSDIKKGVDLCKATCKYFKVCGGGAPSNKYYENGTFKSAETLYCKYTIQIPVDLILSDLETALKPLPSL